MATNFQINGVDFEDTYVKRDVFIEGGLWGSGYNFQSQLGDNTSIHRSSPVQTISGGSNWKTVSCSVYHTLGIKTDGTLWVWGGQLTNYGSLGVDSSAAPLYRRSPVQTAAGGSDWRQCSASQAHSAAVKSDGTLWLWGFNSYGQLGTNDRTHRSSPVQTVSGGNNWKQVSVNGNFSAAIKTDGTLWVWGDNTGGQLGTNNNTWYSSPVQTVSGGNNWKTVSSGGYWSGTGVDLSFVAAIKTDGTLWVWGDNTRGQLGTNDRTHRSSPVQTVSGGNNWKQVSAYLGVGAIKTDGTLWVWGDNTYGQLGDNTITHRSSPVQTVAGGTNWKQVAMGQTIMSAVKTDGTLWTVGYNAFGSLGTNDITHRSSPVQTVSGGNNWRFVSSGSQHFMAIQENWW